MQGQGRSRQCLQLALRGWLPLELGQAQVQGLVPPPRKPQRPPQAQARSVQAPALQAALLGPRLLVQQASSWNSPSLHVETKVCKRDGAFCSQPFLILRAFKTLCLHDPPAHAPACCVTSRVTLLHCAGPLYRQGRLLFLACALAPRFFAYRQGKQTQRGGALPTSFQPYLAQDDL